MMMENYTDPRFAKLLDIIGPEAIVAVREIAAGLSKVTNRQDAERIREIALLAFDADLGPMLRAAPEFASRVDDAREAFDEAFTEVQRETIERIKAKLV
jgi:hypothetical protein